MNDLILISLLLADRSRILTLARGFRANQQQNSLHDTFLLLVVLTAAGILLLVLLRLLDNRQRIRRPVNHPLGLFLALCRAHGLTWSERWLLWRVARSQHLRDPGRLFLEPERLDPANLPLVLRLRWAQLRLLRERLFGNVGHDEPPSPATVDRPPPGPFGLPADQAWMTPTWSPPAK